MKRLPTWVATTALLVVVLTASREAVGQKWLISGGNGTLWDYTQGSGAAMNPRAITPGFAGSFVSGIDFAADGTLFLSTSFPDNRLYKVNPATGASTLVGSTGLPSVIEGDLGFDPTTGVLYGLYNGNNPIGNQFYTLNTSTGAATVIGTVAGDDPSGLAFDNSGQLWVINSNVNSTHIPTLLKVDKSNGNVLSTQSTGVNMGASHPLLGADFNPTTNQLYFAMDNGNFYREDTVTGLATLVDSHGVVNASGLAFVTPEPATPIVLLSGGVAVLWFSMRKRRGLIARASVRSI
jgi:hypothetical protein